MARSKARSSSRPGAEVLSADLSLTPAKATSATMTATTPAWPPLAIAARRIATWPIRIAAAGALLAVAGTALDALVRERLFAEGVANHHLAIGCMMIAASALLCAGAGGLMGLARVVELAARRAGPRTAWIAPGLLVGAAMIAALASPVFWFFSGRGFGDGAAAKYGPYAALAATGIGGAALFWIARAAVRADERGRTVVAAAVGAGLLGAGGILAYLDLTAFVSLYARLHSAVELVAATVWLAGGVVLASIGDRRGGAARRAVELAGVLLVGWATWFHGGDEMRAWAAETLEPVRREPIYAGRLLSRLRYVDAAREGEFGERAVTSRELVVLLDRYGIETVTRHPKWEAPFEEPLPLAEAVRRLRGADRDLNIVVYYVDTLRTDIAYDPERMPNLARFAARSIRFDRAYSTGSDTLSALPGIIGGNYDVRRPIQRSILHTARDHGLAPTVFIPESAYEFLHKLMPDFAFDDTVRLSDYRRGGVWGYGADGPTAGPLVDSALSWMADRDGERFFAWIFNFDVHNWRSLDNGYLRFVADRHGMVDTGDKRFAYDVAARGVDDELGRLLEGIDQLGLRDKTVILFLSDHGEALGYQDFWVHSTFLWESLVNVPIAMSVPGVEPRVVTDPVSLVDVAPTLERFIVDDPTLTSHQGEDLMSYLVPNRPPRRLPLLMVSTTQTKLTRLGIVDGRWKLVLPTDWSAPELYDLEAAAAAPDERDVAAEHPAEVLRLMSELVATPVFTSAHEDLLEAIEEE